MLDIFFIFSRILVGLTSYLVYKHNRFGLWHTVKTLWWSLAEWRKHDCSKPRYFLWCLWHGLGCPGFCRLRRFDISISWGDVMFCVEVSTSLICLIGQTASLHALPTVLTPRYFVPQILSAVWTINISSLLSTWWGDKFLFQWTLVVFL